MYTALNTDTKMLFIGMKKRTLHERLDASESQLNSMTKAMKKVCSMKKLYDFYEKIYR